MPLIHRLLLILIYTGAMTVNVNAAIVLGNIRNAAPGQLVELKVAHQYLDGRTSTESAQVDAQGNFSLAIQVEEPQMVFLAFNDSRLPLFLANQDTLIVMSEAFQFPLGCQFGGQAGANNTVFAQYLRDFGSDFNEFNNIRYKVGQWWANIEEPMNARMEELPPAEFTAYMKQRKTAALALLDNFQAANPGALTPVFSDWLAADIIYDWAYHLTFYGQVFGGRYFVQPEFFEFLYEAPLMSEYIGSQWYRQFVFLFMARQQAKKDPVNDFWAGMYQRAAENLTEKPLAFVQSEIIYTAFSRERFREMLPLYRQFMEHNRFQIFDRKVEDLYQKMARTSNGAVAPEFKGPENNGQWLTLSQLRGKVVYVNFWASWCSSCLRKMEFFNEFETELTANGVEIVNISVDEMADRWQSSLAQNAFKGHHLLASSAQGQNIATAYNVEAVPQYFIISRKGVFMEKAASSQPNDIREQLLRLARD